MPRIPRLLPILSFALILCGCSSAPAIVKSGNADQVKTTGLVIALPEKVAAISVSLIDSENTHQEIDAAAWKLGDAASSEIKDALGKRMTITPVAFTAGDIAASASGGGAPTRAGVVAELEKLIPKNAKFDSYLVVLPGPEVTDPILQTKVKYGGIGAFHLGRMLQEGPSYGFVFLDVALLDSDFDVIAESKPRLANELGDPQGTLDSFIWPNDWTPAHAPAPESDRIRAVLQALTKDAIDAALKEMKLTKDAAASSASK